MCRLTHTLTASAARSLRLRTVHTHARARTQAADRAYQQLLQLQQRDGALRLNHFRRVKQLGAGDVGLVDLVQLQVRSNAGQTRVFGQTALTAQHAIDAHCVSKVCGTGGASCRVLRAPPPPC
jgi:hypothetical protein